METISVRIPTEAKEALLLLAAKVNRKPADVTRIAVLDYLKRKGAL